MALHDIGDSQITLERIRGDYTTYADYESVADARRCRLFITAARRLIIQASSILGEGGTVSFSVADVRAELNEARRWLGAHDRKKGGGATRKYSLRRFRR